MSEQRINLQDWLAMDESVLLDLIRALEESHLTPVDESKYFGYIPLSPHEFLAGLRAAEKLIRGRRFLDVGCGVGSKLFMAERLGWHAVGIEMRPDLVAKSHALCPTAPVAQVDATQFRDYGAYDVIYMYRLAVDSTTCVGLEQLLASRLAPGAILWLPDPQGGVEGLQAVGSRMWTRRTE